MSITTNPNFDPQHSTNHIWRGEEADRCLTDDLDAMDLSIEALDTGKAPVNHEHDGYSPANHTHSGFAPTAHAHGQTDVTGLSDALSGKADLVNGKIPANQIPGAYDEIKEVYIVSGSTPFSAGWLSETATGAALTPSSDKVYIILTAGEYQNMTYRWGGTVYAPIGSDLALGDTSSTAFRGDHGKTAYDHSQNGDEHVTAAQKAAWDGKAAGDHTHTAAALLAMASVLFGTSESGGVEYYYGQGSDKNVLTEMAAWPQGMHTAYSYGGTVGNPKNTESWRIYCHKTSAAIGWVLAFGTSGSVFSNYYDSGWKGWRAIYDALPAPLWTGEMYMSTNQTVTPSKALSECAHGWILLWGDYNPGEGVQNVDFATTVITNRAYSGQKWAGGQWVCVVPRFADADGEAVVVKTLQVHDTKLVGVANNSVSPRNDVVLRAIYEF